MRQLNLKPRGESFVGVRVRIAALGLDDLHLQADRRAQRSARARELRKGAERAERKPMRRRRRWTDETLAEAIATSRSYAEALGKLGLKAGGDTTVILKQDIARLGLQTSHMNGQRLAKGTKNPRRSTTRPMEEILVEDSDYLNTHHLKVRLFKEGLKDRMCEECGLREWCGRPAPLQLDHANGNRRDNRFENLRILCPNCHAQTDTWCSRNRGRYEDLG